MEPRHKEFFGHQLLPQTPQKHGADTNLDERRLETLAIGVIGACPADKL